MSLKSFLGEQSYISIVHDINEKILKTSCNTLLASDLTKKVYQKLNESITPMLEVREFITNAEQIAGDDVSLKEILDFIKKRSETGDLNFIINLCKEEHFANLRRTGHPSPEQTITDIEDKFDEPSSLIEQGIKNGIFDGLQSKLLNKIKSDLNVKDNKLNESNSFIFNTNLVKYNPVGIKLNTENKMLYLMESNILEFDSNTKEFTALNESLDIPLSHRLLMSAINSTPYNPLTETFSLNENWDFDLVLQQDGKILINNKEIPKEKVRVLLLESITIYENDPLKVKDFNKNNYLKAADNFIMLMENANNLIKFPMLNVIKNLNEKSYIIFDNSTIDLSNPKILASNEFKNSLFESYQELVNNCNKVLNNNITNLFENQLINENKLYNSRNEKIVSLNEEQKLLNLQIINVQNLKSMADNDSPAMVKLNEQESTLNNLLNKNIQNLDYYKNNFKLY